MWPIGFFILWRLKYPRMHENITIVPGEVSIIIPARNEELRLPVLLRSLKEQTIQAGEVIVVDDQSSDDTVNTALSFGVRVVKVDEKPSGWVGKSWACWQGARAAGKRILVFLDADVVLGKDGLKKLLSTFMVEKKPVAVQPYHVMKKPYEYLSAFFNIIVVSGLGAFTMAGSKLRVNGMFGPCIVCFRDDYFKAGGHEAVKNVVVEDIALGSAFRRAGFDFSLFGGKGSVNFRMYPEGFRSLVEGWSKGMASAAGTSSLLLLLSILWLSGGTVAFVLILRLAVTLPGALVSFLYLIIYLMYAVQVGWMLRRIGGFGLLTPLFFPVPLMFFHILFSRSFFLTFFKKEITWKGRQV